MNNEVRTDYVKIITRSTLQLGDSVYNIAGLMDEKEDAFFIKDATNRAMNFE